MVKLMYALRRRANMSAEDFHGYWLDRHAPLVLDVAGPKLGMRRYVQSHTVASRADDTLRAPRDTQVPAFDGVAEVWWDSIEALADAWSSADGLAAGAALIKDEHEFIDLVHSPIWIAEEHVIIGE